MGIVLRLLALFLFLTAHHCLHWSAKPANHQVMYACVESDVTIPWTFNTSGKERVTSMEWFYQGHSDEMIAVYAHGSFVVLPSFSNRVEFVPNAGLKLLVVTRGEMGNYSLEVNGADDGGVSFTVRRTIELVVVDSLQTNDGNLHVNQTAAPILDPSSDQWFIQLQCGAFTYVNSPPFDVEWVTPSGAVFPSTSSYENGYFRFRVPNPVTTGNYTCRIPPQSAREACIHDSQSFSSLFLDGVEARLKILEENLQKDNLLLHAQNTKLNATLEAMESQINNLTSELVAVKQSYGQISEGHQVVFYAYQLKGSLEVSTGSRLVMATISVNEGNAYNASTGIFTAPYEGFYSFTASSAIRSESATDFQFSVDGQGVGAYAGISSSSHYSSTSLQQVMNLRVGQRVWVYTRIRMTYASSYSSFSGFLIATH